MLLDIIIFFIIKLIINRFLTVFLEITHLLIVFLYY